MFDDTADNNLVDFSIQRKVLQFVLLFKLLAIYFITLNLCSCFKMPSRSAKTRRMHDRKRYRANADKYKEAAREAYESSTERNFKGGGQKGS